MTKAKVTMEEFAAIWQRCQGHVATIAKQLGTTERSVMYRRLNVEKELGIVLAAGRDMTGRAKVSLPKIGIRSLAQISGAVVVFGDAHFWPNEDRSPAFCALLKIIDELRPSLVVNAGDAFDGARVSRHPPLNWGDLPTVIDELDTCKARIAEIEEKVPHGIPLLWLWGNHDLRFNVRLAQVAPDYGGVAGTNLSDHFEAWDFSFSLMINDTIMIRHRPVNGGIHASYNSVLKAGVSFLHGHLHRCCVTPWADYRGPRFGIDCGTISDLSPEARKFDYDQDGPRNMGQGFAVLTFDDHGRLLPPELCQVIDGKAYFRGSIVR